MCCVFFFPIETVSWEVKISERKDVACFKSSTLDMVIHVLDNFFLKNSSSSDNLPQPGLLMSCVVFEMVIFQFHDCWRKSISSTTLIGVILVEPSSNRFHSKNPQCTRHPFLEMVKNGFNYFNSVKSPPFD